jgi:O-antigen ligase
MQASPRLATKFREATRETRETLGASHEGARSENVPEYRLAMWIMGLDAWRTHPIAGWGIGSIPTIAKESTVTHPTQDMHKVVMIHSTYLHALVEGGLIGACLLLGALALSARAAWYAMRHDLALAGPACAAACWLVAACFDGYHQSGGLLSIGAIIAPLTCGPVRQQA